MEVNADTGWYEGELLASSSYRLNAPLNDYRMSPAREGNDVAVVIRTQGTGCAMLRLHVVNLECDEFEWEIMLGEDIEVRGTIKDIRRPFYAVLIPEGDLRQIQEVYGR